MCVYNSVSKELNKNAEELRLLNDIKDAVGLLTENKIKNRNSGN